MKVVILAAGKGTRLGALTKDTPKPMLSIAGKPVVQHIIEQLMEAGIRDFALVTRYLSEKIEAYFGDGSKFGVSMTYVPQPEKYGTGTALLAASDFVNADCVLMTFSDIVTSPEAYQGVLELFNNTDCDGAIALNWLDDPSSSAAVLTNDKKDIVTRLIEKPKPGETASNWGNAGIFIFKPVIFKYLEKLQPSIRGEYELPDAINAMIDDGLIIRPYFMSEPWKDVGTPEDLALAETILRGVNVINADNN